MAGRIPQSFINDLLDRVDIVDVIERRMTLKKAGKNYQGLCPFHDEKTPSFSVSPDKQFYHCFGCQESGTALTFIMNFERLEFVEAVESLAAQLGLEVPREQGGGRAQQADPNLYDVLARAEQFYRKALRDAPDAIAYLKNRGLTGEIARDFGIGYAPDGWQNLQEGLSDVDDKLLLEAGLANKSDNGRVYDRFRSRIIFPIRDTRGRVIGFGGRVMGADDGPKYLNSPETPVFHKSKELYGLYEARRALRRIDRLLVVEGYMDVVALAQFGFANAVATLGTASGTPHFEKLFRYTDEVVCCFDGDTAGRGAAWKALENALPTLTEHRQMKFMFLPDGEDPDSLIRSRGKQGFNEFIGNAIPALEFLVQRLSQGLDLNSMDGKGRFVGLIEPYVSKLPSGILSNLLQQKIEQITGLTSQSGTRERSVEPQRSTAQSKPGKDQEVSERLLTKLASILTKRPGLWHEVDEETRKQILEAGQDSAKTELMRYLELQPGADVEELLIAIDQPELARQMRSWAAQPLAIGDGALRAELKDLCSRYLQRIEANNRKATLQNLRESANPDDFRRYWQQRKLDQD
ncbi:MAG: DNA primase [Pseudomonadales bacterium]